MRTHELAQIDERSFRELQSELKREGRMGFYVDTGSMAPVIEPGVCVEVVPLERDPEPFDIVAFRGQTKLMCHLILHCNTLPDPTGERTVSTCALSSARDAVPVRLSDIIGLVVSHRIPGPLRARLALKRAWQRLRER